MKKLFLGLLIFSQLGCASFGQKMKNLINGKSQTDDSARVAAKPLRYSDTDSAGAYTKRRYQRVTRKSLEDDAQIDAKSGSLWVMEGQGAYLFSQNVMRMIGDPVSVAIDGEPKDQLESKANVIKKLLAKLEKKSAGPAAAVRNPASDGKPAKAQQAANPTGQQPGGNAAGAEAPGAENENSGSDADAFAFNVKNVPTRITERMVDGNYRVKGSQPFMIGRREYKVIVTGIVRAEDFNEDGVSAGKLLDPSFDIVSNRKTATQGTSL